MASGPRMTTRRFNWDEAIRLHSEGASYYAIAKRFGVSKQSVRLACDDEARLRGRPRTTHTVESRGVVDRIAAFFVFSPDGCWHWTGVRFKNGYGMFFDGKRNARAHRVMYELLVGPIPHGLQIDHLCFVRNCVNPAHLEPVTQDENLRRRRPVISERTTRSDA